MTIFLRSRPHSRPRSNALYAIILIATCACIYGATALFSSNLAELNRIDWAILQNRSFSRDPEDPGKVERYQAEALVHKHLPLDSLDGIVCNSELVEADLKSEIAKRGLTLTTAQKPSWYF